MQYLLVKTDHRKVFLCPTHTCNIYLKAKIKQWRWSSHGNFYVHNIAAKTTHPIVPPTNPATTAYATWSPTGHAIAFVTNNDLYVLPSAESVQFLPLSSSYLIYFQARYSTNPGNHGRQRFPLSRCSRLGL